MTWISASVIYYALFEAVYLDQLSANDVKKYVK